MYQLELILKKNIEWKGKLQYTKFLFFKLKMFKTKQYTGFFKYMYTFNTLRPEWKGTFNFRIIVILVEGKNKNGVWEGLSVALNL